jgi:hypothetical protein
MARDLLIEIVGGPGKGRVFRVGGDRFIIGRGPRGEVDVNLEPDRFVSRRHAIRRVEADGIVIEEWPEAPSKAGLVVDGSRRQKVCLADGGRLWVVATELCFRWAERPTSVWREKVRRWLRRLFLLLPLLAVAAGLAAARPLRFEPERRPLSREELAQVWEARNRGDFAAAQAMIRTLREQGEEKEIQEEIERLECECRRWLSRIAALEALEQALRLDECRDEWRRLALDLPAEDPLRSWIENQAMARLTARLQDLER